MEEKMSWLIAFVIVAVVVASLVGGAALHPVPYGIFTAAAIIGPLPLFTAAGGALFGKGW